MSTNTLLFSRADISFFSSEAVRDFIDIEKLVRTRYNVVDLQQ